MDFPIHPASAGADDGAGRATSAGVEPDADSGTDGPAVGRLVSEVLHYPERFPQAAGGIDDSARRWIAKQRLEDPLLQVEQSVRRLVVRGLVEALRVGDRWVRDRRRTGAARSPTPTAGAARDDRGVD